MADILLPCSFWKLPSQHPIFLLPLLPTVILQPCLLGGLSPFTRSVGKMAVAPSTGYLAQTPDQALFNLSVQQTHGGEVNG